MNKVNLLAGLFAVGLITGLTACNTQSTSTAAKVKTPQNEMEPISVPFAKETEVSFKAADGGAVFADLHITDGAQTAPFIILFHQAGASGRGEYTNIIPKLKDKGYDLLVVDQRSGGGYFGSENRTVKARGKKSSYCAAYPDMEAALAFTKTKTDGAIFAWGSSYSAALSLKLASEHGADLAGVLSFSPAAGKGMGPCAANNFIAGVNIPALGLRPDSEMGNDINKGGQAQRTLYQAQDLEYYVAKDGVHGSSMLDPQRAKGDTEPTWDAVLAFLEKHK